MKRRIRMCPTGKLAYLDRPSAESALAELGTIPQAYSDVRTPRRFYLCPQCGMYHLTSSNRRRRPDAQR